MKIYILTFDDSNWGSFAFIAAFSCPIKAAEWKLKNGRTDLEIVEYEIDSGNTHADYIDDE